MRLLATLTIVISMLLVQMQVSAQTQASGVLNNVRDSNVGNLLTWSQPNMFSIRADVAKIVLGGNREHLILNNFKISDSRLVSLRLEHFDITNSSFCANVVDSTGSRDVSLSKMSFFKGMVEGCDSSFVFLAFFGDYCYGLIDLKYNSGDTSEHFQITPSNGTMLDGNNTMQVSSLSQAQWDEINNTICGSIGDIPIQRVSNKNHQGVSVQSNRTKLEFDLAVDSDSRFTQQFNLNYGHAANFALAIIAATSALYERDLNISLHVNYLRLWLIGPGNPRYPYPACTDYNTVYIYQMTGTGNTFAMRSHWTDVNYWKPAPPERSMVYLLSGDALSGRAANFGGFCNPPYAYAMGGSMQSNFYGSVHTAGHELGHALNLYHTCSQFPAIECSPDGSTPIMYGDPCRCPGPSLNYFHASEQTIARQYAVNTNCVRSGQNTNQDLEIASIQQPVQGSSIYNGKSAGICPLNNAAPLIPKITIRNRGNTSIVGVPTLEVSVYDASDHIVHFVQSGAFLDKAIIPIPLLGSQDILTLSTPPMKCEDLDVAAGPFHMYAQIIHKDANNVNIDPNLNNNSYTTYFQSLDALPVGNLTLTSPNAPNIVFTAGQQVAITFSPASSGPVHVDFSPDDGISWYPIDSTGSIALSPTIWRVPPIRTTLGRLRVRSENDAYNVAISDYTFGITVVSDIVLSNISNMPFDDFNELPSIFAPYTPLLEVYNAGILPQTDISVEARISRFIGGQEYEVYSERKNVPSLANGQSTVVQFPELAIGKLPANVYASDYYIYHASVYPKLDDDVSNNTENRTFRVYPNTATLVVTSPLGEDHIQVLRDNVIRWQVPSQIVNCPPPYFLVDIDYTTDGQTFIPIAQSVPTINGVGTYIWHTNVQPTKDNNARIRIQANPHLNVPCHDAVGISEYFSIDQVQPPTQIMVYNVSNNGAPRVQISFSKPSHTTASSFAIYRSINSGAYAPIVYIDAVPDPRHTYVYNDDDVQSCTSYSYFLKSIYTDWTTPVTTVYSVQSESKDIKPIPTYTSYRQPNQHAWWRGATRYDPYGDGNGTAVRSGRVQFIVRANELTAAGFTPTSILTDIGFLNIYAQHGKTLRKFRIRVKYTAQAEYANGVFDNVGLETVCGSDDDNTPLYYKPNSEPSPAWNMHNLRPMSSQWNGLDNLLVDVSFVQEPSTDPNNIVGIIPSSGSSRCFKELVDWRSTVYASSATDDITNTPNGQIASNTGAFDTWRPDFIIEMNRPQLDVTYPNSSVTFVKGRKYVIAWNPGCDDLNRVDIHYIDYGSLQNSRYITGTVAGNTNIRVGAPNSGDYEWTVPTNIPSTTTARIRIEDLSNTNYYAESTGYITIRDQNTSLAIISPTAATVWMQGGRKTISWTTSGTDQAPYIRVEYSDDGVSWRNVASAVANTGNYTWDITGVTPTATARVRISDVSNSEVFAISSLFTVHEVPSPIMISVDAQATPKGIKVKWSEPVGIDVNDHAGYFVCRGSSQYATEPIALVSAGVSEYLDQEASECTRYYYTVVTRTVGGMLSARSSAGNSIIQTGAQFAVTSPNGGERWYAGSTHLIKWSACGVTFSNARIEYTPNNGATWITIAASVPNSGEYSWLVPTVSTSTVKVRVVGTSNGDPSDLSDATFEIVVLPDASAACGSYHDMVLKRSTATVYSWGLNNYGQIGDGTTTNRVVPTLIQGLTNVSEVSGGGYHSMARTSQGNVYCWGLGYYGQLGLNSTSSKYTPCKVEYDNDGQPFSGLVSIAGGGNFSMALSSSGDVYCWGRNDHGQIGDGGNTSVLLPKKVVGLGKIKQIAAGESIAFALAEDGSLWAWGSFSSYWPGLPIGVGDNTTNERRNPVFILSGVNAISSHGEHAIALRRDGSVWSWGDKWFSQLGYDDGGNTDMNLAPHKVTGLTNVEQVFTGTYQSYAVTSGAVLWGWGSGNSGQLANGVYSAQPFPIQISTNVAGMSTLACGVANSMIYKIDGEVCTSGYNMFGCLGDPSISVNDQRNLFACLSDSYARSPSDSNAKQDYEIVREFAPMQGDNDTLCLKYRLMKAISIQNVKDNNDLVVTPNPTSGDISVLVSGCSAGKLSVYDLLGNTIASKEYSVKGNSVATINIPLLGFPSGVYMLRNEHEGVQSRSIPFIVLR